MSEKKWPRPIVVIPVINCEDLYCADCFIKQLVDDMESDNHITYEAFYSYDMSACDVAYTYAEFYGLTEKPKSPSISFDNCGTDGAIAKGHPRGCEGCAKKLEGHVGCEIIHLRCNGSNNYAHFSPKEKRG